MISQKVPMNSCVNNKMVGHVTALHTDATLATYTVYIPLTFWFCQNIGLSLTSDSLIDLSK